jgi:hypothetical protein
MKNESHIPSNHEGVKTDTSSSVQFTVEQEAVEHFKIVKSRFLTIAKWGDVSGKGSADFELTDSSGNIIHRFPQQGDYIRIDIPGPGTDKGNGYEWVQIEAMDEEKDLNAKQEIIVIKVSPASSPQNNSKSIAHFFQPGASSTFMIKLTGSIIHAEVHGRNEKPNMNTSGILNKIRNFFITIGAFLGISKLQWKSLVKGLVKK